MDPMKKLAAAVKSLRLAIAAGDWYATLVAYGELAKAMADAGKAVVGPFLPTAAGSVDVETELWLLEAECGKPRTAATDAAFDWTTLIPLIISLIEAWRKKK